VYTVAFVLYLAFLAVRPFGSHTMTVVSDVVVLPLSYGASVAAWMASRTPSFDELVRRGWQLVALAYLAYGLGDTIWASLEIAFDVPPYPSPADLVYLLFYPTIFMALFAFSDRLVSRERRLTFALDASIVLIAGVMFVVHVVLR